MKTKADRLAPPTARALAAVTTMTGASLLGLLGTASPAHATAVPANPTVQATSGPGVAVAAAPSGAGYLSAWTDGTVVASDGAAWEGDLRGQALSGRVVGITPTPDGKGYWLVGSDGGVFAFGDAAFYGSTGAMTLNAPIVGMESTPDGRGYWLVASDGGIFAFGDAAFHGSTGAIALESPIVGMAAAPGGAGYWLVASDGGIFAFGDAAFHGSLGGTPLDAPIVNMAATADGSGYWLVASDGGVFAFGSAPFAGSGAGSAASSDTVALAREGAGYWLLGGNGSAQSFGGPATPHTAAALSAVASPTADPATSIPPSSAFAHHCLVAASAASCTPFALADVDGARALEDLPPLALPAGFTSLGLPSQIVAVTDAERTSRGLPSLVESGGLDSLAGAGAAAGSDPSGPAGTTWTGVYASGYDAPLAADFAWLYDDGIGSSNSACPATGGSGCWGHRQNLLVPWGGAMGGGAAGRNLTALIQAS